MSVRLLVLAVSVLAPATLEALQQVSSPIPLAVLPAPAGPSDSAFTQRFASALVRHLARSERFDLLERPIPLARRAARYRPARYLVYAAARQAATAPSGFFARVWAVETGESVLQDSMLAAGPEEAAAGLASRLTSRLAELDVPRRPVIRARPTVPAPPAAAIMAYARGTLFRDRGDTARAVEYLRRALTLFPGYEAACRDLRLLRPAAECP